MQKAFLALLVPFMLGACKPDTNSGAVDARLSALEARLDAISRQQRDDGYRLTAAEYTARAAYQEPAFVSTDGNGYGVARSRLGSLLVVVKEIKPHLDGYKVSLHVGNLTSATMGGADLNVEWGVLYDPTKPETLNAPQYKKDASTTRALVPGQYTVVDIALTPAKPDEVKVIRVHVNPNTMSLMLPLKDKQ